MSTPFPIPPDFVPSYEFFHDGCEILISNICKALKLAGLRVDACNIVEFAKTLPRSGAEIDSEVWQGFTCGRCLRLAFERDPEAYRPLGDYFLRYYIRRSYHAQEMLVEGVTGVIDGLFRRCVIY